MSGAYEVKLFSKSMAMTMTKSSLPRQLEAVAAQTSNAKK
jgi:hypothetical protein